MQISYGSYVIKTHELDQKLSVQVTSPLGEVHLQDEGEQNHGFPNSVCFELENPTEIPEAKGLKKYAFGEYSFILGIKNSGKLCLFYTADLNAGKKVIDGKDTLNLAFLKDPKA